jgi:hypothetical protein
VCIGTYIRIVRKERKSQHQNPEFGHTQGEYQKNPTKKYISIWGGGGLGGGVLKAEKPKIFVVN